MAPHRDTPVGRAHNAYTSSISRHRRRQDALGEAIRAGLTSQELGADASIPGYLTVTDQGVLHGKGVLAARAFPAGFQVILCTGVMRAHDPQADNAYCYSMEEAGEPLVNLDCSAGNLVKYVNSCGAQGAPNCALYSHGKLLILTTLEAIAEGVELLVDYAFDA